MASIVDMRPRYEVKPGSEEAAMLVKYLVGHGQPLQFDSQESGEQARQELMKSAEALQQLALIHQIHGIR